MKRLPFVLGTDIIRIARLDPINKSSNFIYVARRILHPYEFSYHKRKSLESVDHKHRKGLYEWLTVKFPPPRERDQAQLDISPEIQRDANNAARWLAGRWAAKEAAMKAWGAGLLSWKDVRVVIDTDAPSAHDNTSRPVKIVCQPNQGKGDDFGEMEEELRLRQDARLSISHDGEYCVATVIAEPLSEGLLAVFMNRARAVKERQESGWRRRDEGVQREVTRDEAIQDKTSGYGAMQHVR